MSFARFFYSCGSLLPAALLLAVGSSTLSAGSPEIPREKAGKTHSRTGKTNYAVRQAPPKIRVAESEYFHPAPVSAVTTQASIAPSLPELLEELHYQIGLLIFGIPPLPPYLQQVSTPPIRVSTTEPFVRRPPLLPKIVVATPGAAVPEAAPQPSTPPSALPESAEPEEGVKRKPIEDVVDFFRDSGDRQGNEKGLGDAFDPEFTPVPAPAAPTSSATYRRE